MQRCDDEEGRVMPGLVDTATSIKFWEMVEAKARMVICSIQYGERAGNDVAALHSEGIADLKSNINMAELTEISASNTSETITVEKTLFKELLQVALELPELGSKLATVDVDCSTTTTGEALVRLKPGDFLLRLNAALRACG